MPRSFNIIIVGAGMGGLGAAIALKRKGHDVTVLESATELNEIGAGIQIPPNSSKILISYGLEEKLLEKVVWPRRMQFRRYATGDIVGFAEYHPAMSETYGFPYWLIHRADYQKILYDAAIELGVHVLLGSPIEAVEESGPIVILKSGQQLTADLVVGADGIRSRITKSVLKNNDVEAVDSPNCACRATVPADVMLSDPKVSHLMTDPNTNLWFGHERHIVAYPIRQGTIYNVFMSHPGKGSVGKWNEPGNVEEMRKYFSNWDPVIQQVLSHIEECRKWKLAYLPPLEKWVSDSGRVVLIGDAAHGMLPYMAQGAAVSIEDGAALAECPDRAESVSDLGQPLSAFEMIRKPRCEAISKSALANADVWHLPDGPAQQGRDRKMGKIDEKEAKKDPANVDKWSGKDQQRGLFGYDTVKETNDFLNRLGSNGNSSL